MARSTQIMMPGLVLSLIGLGTQSVIPVWAFGTTAIIGACFVVAGCVVWYLDRE